MGVQFTWKGRERGGMGEKAVRTLTCNRLWCVHWILGIVCKFESKLILYILSVFARFSVTNWKWNENRNSSEFWLQLNRNGYYYAFAVFTQCESFHEKENVNRLHQKKEKSANDKTNSMKKHDAIFVDNQTESLM